MSNNAEASGSNDPIVYRMPYRVEETTDMFGVLSIDHKFPMTGIAGKTPSTSSTRDNVVRTLDRDLFERIEDQGDDVYKNIQKDVLKQKIDDHR